MSINVNAFWFESKRIDDRRNKSYGLQIRFYLKANNTIDHHAACKELKKKYTSCDVLYYDSPGRSTLCGTYIKQVDKPSKIPEESQLIGELGGIEEIEKDFVLAASSGLEAMEDALRVKELTDQARQVFASYWNSISREAKERMDYNARLNNLKDEFRLQAEIIAKELFVSLGDASGISTPDGKEMVYEPEAMAMARKKILEYTKTTVPDSFFSRGSHELIHPDDFKEEEK